MTGLGDVLELVRAPAALTVIGDALTGATAARGALDARALPLVLASASLYTAGMALNDYADADLDAVERPERPIPSGRISRGGARGIGIALTLTGVGLARLGGRAPASVAVATAAMVWTYDLVAKNSAAGPVVMGVCRGLDVMMGAAGRGWRRGLVPAALVAGHTTAFTAVSRGEVHGTSRSAAAASALTSAAAAAGAVAVASRGPRGGTAAAVVAASGFLGACLPAQLRAAREPDAHNARSATRASIGAMIPLQTAMVAGAGSALGAAVLCAAQATGQLLRSLSRRGDVT